MAAAADALVLELDDDSVFGDGAAVYSPSTAPAVSAPATTCARRAVLRSGRGQDYKFVELALLHTFPTTWTFDKKVIHSSHYLC